MQIAVFDDMTQCTPAAVAQMLPLVSVQRREQAQKFKHTLGQFCCLKSWLMLRDLIADEAQMSKPWLYNENGKPYWPDGPFFSISHCAQGIAVAVGEMEVGIDIEAIRHAEEALIERTMNTAERVQITDDRTFTRLWTQKEAVLKMEGTGIESFEQLQSVLSKHRDIEETTVEKEKYIYSIAYGKLHCIGAEI